MLITFFNKAATGAGERDSVSPSTHVAIVSDTKSASMIGLFGPLVAPGVAVSQEEPVEPFDTVTTEAAGLLTTLLNISAL